VTRLISPSEVSRQLRYAYTLSDYTRILMGLVYIKHSLMLTRILIVAGGISAQARGLA
jgi:hypothetical protein